MMTPRRSASVCFQITSTVASLTKALVSLFTMKFNNINVKTQLCAAKNVCFKLINPNSFVSKSTETPTTDELCTRYIKASKRRSVRGVKSHKWATV